MTMTCPLDARLKATVGQALRVDPDALDGGTVFRELSVWDSFAALALIYGIEDDFGVQVGYGALEGVATLGELQGLIEAQLAQAGSASLRRRQA